MSVANYPEEWKRVARTRDGVEYRIRPIRADDLLRDKDFLTGLSPESRYTRLFCVVREPSAALLEQFVHVDYHSSMAFVAVIGEEKEERIIGVARYAADPDPNGDDCEFAVAVADSWQGRGVGATLTQLLFEYARTQGFHKLHGDVLANNSRMIELVHWLGMQTHRRPDDGTLVEASREP